jgi:hypothetical protein
MATQRPAPFQRNLPESFDSQPFPGDVNNFGGGPGVSSNSNEFHVDFLKQQFRDIARPNLFKVKITPPPILNADWNNKLAVLAKSAVFPSIEIQNYEYERGGRILHIPSNKMNYGDMTITFYNDVDFNLRSLFNRWQRLAIYNWQKEVGSIPLMALDATVTVYQFDSSHRPVYGINIDNCWPKTISEIQLSQENTDQLEEFSVTFVFTTMNILKGI